MTERPILFSGPMILALLDGRKTQTRRVIMPQPMRFGESGWTTGHRKTMFRCAVGETHEYAALAEVDFRRGLANTSLCPYGAPGDRLWVRERMRVIEVKGVQPTLWVRVRYEADSAPSALIEFPERLKWMPRLGKCLSYGGHREASRITLEVTGVRVERLQEIKEADAVAEGCESEVGTPPNCHSKAVCNYQVLWDSLNAKRENGAYAWEKNPWVWAIMFREATMSDFRLYQPEECGLDGYPQAAHLRGTARPPQRHKDYE